MHGSEVELTLRKFTLKNDTIQVYVISMHEVGRLDCK